MAKLQNVWFQKVHCTCIHSSPMDCHWKFQGGEGLKSQSFIIYEAKLEFPRGSGGGRQNNLPCKEYGYFLQLRNTGPLTPIYK